MLRIRITFDADPDSVYLFRADPVTDFLCESGFSLSPLVRIRSLIFLCESGSDLSPLVRLRLLILYDANPDSLYLFGADPVTDFIFM
jgi:hypothetical protein